MPFLIYDFRWLLLIYFALISLVAIIITTVDKYAAKKGMRRIPEATLMTVGLFGGALFMFVTMKTIHHKTRHKKFMVGLPIFIAVHAAAACYYVIEFIV